MKSGLPPCGDVVQLAFTDNRGNVLSYILQRSPSYRDSSGPAYQEILLPSEGGVVSRQVLQDFQRLAGYNAVGATIVAINFEVGAEGWAILDNLRIGPAIPTPPKIAKQPESQTAAVGSTIIFSVVAEGSPPLSYQWQKGGVDLPGGTGTSFIIQDVQKSDAGNYAVRISNSVDGVTSVGAMLWVNSPPTISPIDDVEITIGETINPIPFSAGDAETPAGDLRFDISSSNQDLLPSANIERIRRRTIWELTFELSSPKARADDYQNCGGRPEWFEI